MLRGEKPQPLKQLREEVFGHIATEHLGHFRDWNMTNLLGLAPLVSSIPCLRDLRAPLLVPVPFPFPIPVPVTVFVVAISSLLIIPVPLVSALLPVLPICNNRSELILGLEESCKLADYQSRRPEKLSSIMHAG